LLTGGDFDWGLPIQRGDGEVVEQVRDIFETQVPIRGGCSGSGHDAISKFLEFLNPSFGVILMLMMGFALKTIDVVQAKDVLDGLAYLNLRVVAEKEPWGPVLADKILDRSRHFGFRVHGVDSG
jgi:hypothetical protein